ncbi:MAG TPA: CoA transferase [Dehalococcoidia bacterium]|nr:CoA transferase [Dehalococcoidia bacterium]
MSGALDDIRVIDFGQFIAGPLTGMLLADQGADVIKVDPPGGPSWDTPANATWNRGKRSLVLNLKDGADIQTARRLIASTDVVIENFRPGVMERLGLGHEAMTAAHPRLLYCSLPGFAADDPRAAQPAWEGVVAAATASYRQGQGSGGAPLFTAVPIASTYAAFIASVSIISALYSREHDGRGQHIEVPLFDATFAAIGANGLSVRGSEASGGRPKDFGGGIFECADGRWVQVALAKPHFQQRFAQAAGLADRVDIDRLASELSERDKLAAMLPTLFRERPADEWEALGAQADLPLIKVRSAGEWIDVDHARASATIVDLDDPQLGPTAQPNSPVRLAGADPRDRQPRHALDVDRDSVLANLDGGTGEDSQPAEAQSASRATALEGVTVIDLSQVLAGPMGGRTLAEFGADVVKINPPDEQGAGIRFSVHRYHTDVNRAKRTMLLDLKRPGALDLFWRLLEDADVVLHNFRPGTLERLGIDYATARQRRPGIIYVSITAYGADGPWGGRPGYEPFGQAPTGLSARQGGSDKPLGQPFAVNDYGTGLMSSFAAVLSLFARERTGEGSEAEAALAFTGSILQSPYLIDYDGKQWDEPAGLDATGWGPLQRLYRSNEDDTDGDWFFLGARDRQLADLARVPGLDGVDGLSGASLEAELERRFAEGSAEEWCERLVAAGIGAHRLTGIAELMDDPWVIAHGLSLTRAHDNGSEITTVGPVARLSGTPVVAGRPAVSPGADGLAILEGLGLGDEFEALIEAADAPAPVAGDD